MSLNQLNYFGFGAYALPGMMSESTILRDYLNPAVSEVVVSFAARCPKVLSVMQKIYVETIWAQIDVSVGDVVIPTDVDCEIVLDMMIRGIEKEYQ